MRPFSRWMPVLQETPCSISEYSILITLGITAAVTCHFIWPVMVAVLVGCILLAPFLIVWTIVGSFFINRKLRRLAAERAGEDIGTFARSFNRNSEPFDPWVIRATWDALAWYLMVDGAPVPLRASDRFEELPIDPDDTFLSLISEIADRSGHSAKDVKDNPIKRIETVGDLVKFITLQPRMDAIASSQSA